jgi:hypothetical protein
MRGSFVTFAVALVFATTGPALAAPEPVGAPVSEPSRPVDPRVRNLLARLPLAFETNRGQAPEGWDFLVRCRGYHAFVASDAVVFSFDGAGLQMSLDGAARCEPETRGLELAGKANYFLGNDPSKWISNVPLSRGAVYRDAAPGTTWTFGGSGRALEFAFELGPGVAGPTLRFEGALATSIAADGSLRLAMPHGVATMSAPVARQDGSGTRIPALARWAVAKDGSVRVDVAARDPSRRVHVDPTVTYESYLGGSSDDNAIAAAMDSSGSAYVAGQTYSSNFPATSGAFSTSLTPGTNGGRTDGFVVKLNASGSALAYATYFGGSSDEYVTAMQVDASGRAYMVGRTYSTNFPVTPGAYSASYGGNGVLLSLNASGSALYFSTCTLRNMATGVALGSNGGVFVCEGAELAHYSSLGTQRDFGTTIATISANGGFNDVACDADGRAYAVGAIVSAGAWPATSGAYRSTVVGSSDALITKVDATGNVIWTTYLGGSQGDEARVVGVNDAGQVYVSGRTGSSDFPVTSGAFASAYSNTGTPDAFVTRLDAVGASLRYSTYCGGLNITSLRVHRYSSWVCAGSTGGGSLTTSGAFQAQSGGASDGVVLSFNRDNTLAWSSFVGGSGVDAVDGLGMAPDGSVVLAGFTTSTDFPTVSPYQGTQGSYADGFVLTVPDNLPTSLPALAVAESNLPQATITADYGHPIAGTGGVTPYTWAVVSGTPPPGTSLAANGMLNGTPTQTGSFPFRVRVTDASEVFAEGDVSLTVNPLPSLPGAILGTTIGTLCDRVVPVSGGTAPFTIELLTGTAPDGLTLGANGHLTGTATTLGDSALTIRAHDAYGLTATGGLTIRVNAAPSIVAATPPGGTTTKTYAFTFTTADGTAPFTWTVASGALPATLGASTGALSGAAKAPGVYEFVLRATDAVGAIAERGFAVDVHALPTLDTLVLRPMTIGRPFAQTLSVSGGTPPFTWAPGSGDFPGGFQIDASTARLSGTPTLPGLATAMVSCTDRWGAVALQSVSFDVATLVDLTRKKSSDSLTFESGGADHVTRALELTAGSSVQIAMTGGRVGDSPPQLALTDSAGSEVDLAPYKRTTRNAVSVKGLVIAETGRYFLTATPADNFTGKSKLTVAVSPRGAWPSGATLDAGATSEFRFSAPPGALLSIAVKAPKGSAALPRIVSVTGPDATDPMAGGSTIEKNASAKFATKVPLAGGDYRVVFGTRDATTGPVTWTVKVKLPKLYEFALPDLVAGE